MQKRKLITLLFISIVSLSGCSSEMTNPVKELPEQQKQAILNGHEVGYSAKNGVVSIFVKDHPQYQNQIICTGTMITPKHILTAAHCVAELSSNILLFNEDSKDPDCQWQGGNISIGGSDVVNYIKIGVGQTLMSSLLSSYDVHKIMYHSGYSSLADAHSCTETNYDGYSVTRNDIAIIELKTAIPESENQPMPLLPPWLGLSQTDIDDGMIATFMGYGYDEDGNRGVNKFVNLPLEMHCPLGSEWLCPYSKTVHVQGCHPDSYLCYQYGKLDYFENKLAIPAGSFLYLQKDGGPCQGDSGGPAFVSIGRRTYLAGITSYGDNACSSYGISTSVQDFYEWIVKNVPDAKKQITEVCGNGLDDDNNGKIDAQDPACKEQSYCGDGKVDPALEQCDGDLFADEMTECTDWSFAFESGEVGCSENCEIDYSNCVKFEPPNTCGNQNVESENGEQCDGSRFNNGFGEPIDSNLCSDFSAFFVSGELKCNDNCTVDTSGCSSEIEETSYCGDGIIQSNELCDGDKFIGGISTQCQDWDSKYKEGTVKCVNCKPNLSGCIRDSICGDGKLSDSELCDGKLFLADETSCTEWMTQMDSGQVSCTANCSLDLSSCHMAAEYADLCGNHVLDDHLFGTELDHFGEECDGDLFKKGTNCSDWDERFVSGDVTCNSNCTVNLEQCILGSNALYLDDAARSSMYLLNSNPKPTTKAPEKESDTVTIIVGGNLKEDLPDGLVDTEPDPEDNPETPDNPDTPENPNTPENPENPANSDVPENPANPDTPENPENPDNPGSPTEPSSPDEPGQSEVSDTPDQPTEPGFSEDPVIPEHSSIQKKNSSGCSTMSLMGTSTKCDITCICMMLCFWGVSRRKRFGFKAR